MCLSLYCQTDLPVDCKRSKTFHCLVSRICEPNSVVPERCCECYIFLSLRMSFRKIELAMSCLAACNIKKESVCYKITWIVIFISSDYYYTEVLPNWFDLLLTVVLYWSSSYLLVNILEGLDSAILWRRPLFLVTFLRDSWTVLIFLFSHISFRIYLV